MSTPVSVATPFFESQDLAHDLKELAEFARFSNLMAINKKHRIKMDEMLDVIPMEDKGVLIATGRDEKSVRQIIDILEKHYIGSYPYVDATWDLGHDEYQPIRDLHARTVMLFDKKLVQFLDSDSVKTALVQCEERDRIALNKLKKRAQQNVAQQQTEDFRRI